MPAPDDGRPLVVVTIGGGDGAGEEVLGGWLRMLREHAGEVDFDSLLLTGPFLEPELAARLRVFERRLSTADTSKIVVGEVELDTAAG